jgi:hypothetical protein
VVGLKTTPNHLLLIGNLQFANNFPIVWVFSAASSVVESSFIALCSDNMQEVIAIFIYLLRLGLWHKLWSILDKVPWTAEKYVSFRIDYSLAICQVHYIYGAIQFYIFFVDFCLDDLFIGDKGVLNSPTTTVLGSICVFMSISVFFKSLVHWYWVHIY